MAANGVNPAQPQLESPPAKQGEAHLCRALDGRAGVGLPGQRTDEAG